MVTYAQLLAAGLTHSAINRRKTKGTLHRIHRGVYAVGHPAITSHARLLAAVLACGDGALLSHRSAAHVWGLGYFAGVEEVTVGRSAPGPPRIIVHTSRTIRAEQRCIVDVIPVTSVNRTLVDLADVVRDPRRLAKAVHEADVQQKLDVAEILPLLNGRRGSRRLRLALAGHMPADLKSDLEFDAHRAIVTSGLPQPQTNVVVRAAGREFVVDLLWPDQRLIAEIDGPAHRSKRSFESDRERDSLLQLAGYRIVRFTKKRLRTDRQAVIDEIAAHLA